MAQPYKGYINTLNQDVDFKAIYTTTGAKNLNFTGKSIVVLNDGLDDVTVNVNGLSFLVRGGTFYSTVAGEATEIRAGDFKTFTITATTAFRCWVRGV